MRSLHAVELDPPLAHQRSKLHWARYASWADLLGQQAAWWAAVLSIRVGLAGLAAVGPALLVIAHVVLANDRRARLSGALFAMSIGLVVDATLMASGVIRFPGQMSVVPPLWMIGLWGAFGVGFFASLRRLRSAPVWARAAFGAFGGLFAYHAGHRLEVLQVSSDIMHSGALAIAWALAVVIISFGTARLDRERVL